jgi:hypothetical protein
MQPGNRLFDWCDGILAGLETWEMENAEGWLLPARRLIAHGAPAWDCELVAVWCENTTGYEGDVTLPTPGPLSPQGARSMRVATIGISIVRCDLSAAELDLRGGEAELPSASSVTETARSLYADQAHMMNAVLNAEKAHNLFTNHQWAPLTWTPEGPDGGLAGSTLRLAVALVIAPV